ncbi:MAG: RNA-binding protein [Phaeodactylibacter sp.]|nr:RNA-binding protein [Phaeodactylibacter sp.]
MNIFVARLNFDTDSDALRTVFEAYGDVDSAKVINDHFTGKSRGFGFVEMPDDEQATNAIKALNESDLDGNTIVVKEAEPREKRGGGGGRDRGGYGGGRDRGGYGGRRDDYGGGRDRRDRDDYRSRRDDDQKDDRY